MSAENQPEPTASPPASSHEENEDNPSSSPCTLSSTASPPTSPPTLLMPNHHTMLMQQKTFIPNRSLLSKLEEIGVPLEGARRALFYTGNRSVGLAINWLMEDRDLDTPVEEDIEAIGESFDGHQGRNVVITREIMGEEEDDDSDMEEDMELMLVLLVNKSLNLSAGKMSLAGARATARVTMLVKEVMGMETVVMWDQCGRNTEVRGVENAKEMETIFYQVKMMDNMGVRIVVDSDQQWTGEEEEMKVMAVFGETEEVQDMIGHLSFVR